MVSGISDMGRHFHLFGLMLCCGETTDDYAFFSRFIRYGVERTTGNKMIVDKLIADAAAAIHNGFEQVFNDYVFIVIMCFFHVVFNFNKRKFVDSTNKPIIREDMEFLHMAYSREVFEAGSKLFIQKWIEK